jgi:DNA-binding FadR family transcriptional regulator
MRAGNLFDPDVLAWQSEAVLALDESFIRTFSEVRLIIETAAAGLAATRATSEEKALLTECFGKMERCVDDKPVRDEADIAFHGVIFDASHNELLRQIGKTIRAALRRQDRSGSESELGTVIELHGKVCQAICEGDAKAATIAMESVILHAAQTFFDSFEYKISSGRYTPNAPEDPRLPIRTARNLLRELQKTLNPHADQIVPNAPAGDAPVSTTPSEAQLKP